MERKSNERRIVSFLVVLLVIEVALLCVHLRFGGFHWSTDLTRQRIAGRVARSENELRRRGNNSLVWEKSASDDEVYFYDSILTLAQSTASLQLYQDTEVKLSENTLVTIEPQERRGSGEIRLKFVKGSLRARNPFAAAHLEADTWAMEIKSGSELDFRQVGEDKFELEVTKGEVDFKSTSGEKKVSSAEMLRIESGGESKKITVDDNLVFIDPPPARIYTHQPVEKISLNWRSNSARELVVQTVGLLERTIEVEGQTHAELSLPPGHHQVFLRVEGTTSPAASFDIWKAPVLHLVSPLPRNRIRLGEQTAFLWMTSPEVKSYEFSLRGLPSEVRQSLDENSFSLKLESEGDAEWSVEGRDFEGYRIPPLYSYPLFIREAPLAAPKLHAPALRQPAKVDDRGASYWFSLLPEAFADEILYQAVFDWDKVDGADRYVIEISETPDFRSPLVNRTVNTNQFVWKKMELKSYYWRVAAETRRGRLGLFSDPELVDLKSGGVGVAVMPLESAPPPAPPPVEKEKPIEVTLGSEPPQDKVEKAPEPVDLKPVAAPAPPPIEKYEMKPHAFIEWMPRYTLLKASAPQNASASLSGGNLNSFAVGADRVYEAEQMVRLQFNYAHETYKPQPKDSFPLQGDLSWNEFSFTAVLHKSSSHLGYGLYAERGADLARETDQSVTMQAANFVGACLQSYYQFGRVYYTADYIFTVGSDYGLMTRQDLRFTVSGTGIYFGLGADGFMRSRSGAHASELTGRAALGFDF